MNWNTQGPRQIIEDRIKLIKSKRAGEPEDKKGIFMYYSQFEGMKSEIKPDYPAPNKVPKPKPRSVKETLFKLGKRVLFNASVFTLSLELMTTIFYPRSQLAFWCMDREDAEICLENKDFENEYFKVLSQPFECYQNDKIKAFKYILD